MTEHEWTRFDADRRGGRSLAEARTLKRLYGSVVGVPLVDPDTLAKLGCMTLHTRSDRPLTPDEADSVVQLAVMRAPELSRQIAHRTGMSGRL